MAKYLLSYDEQDVKNGKLDVSPDGVLRSAGSSEEPPVIYIKNVNEQVAYVDPDCTIPYDTDSLINACRKGAYATVANIGGFSSLCMLCMGFGISEEVGAFAVFFNTITGSSYFGVHVHHIDK